MSRTERLPTAHGEVEYETVECTSCGESVVKEEAVRVFVGEYRGTDSWHHKSYDEVKLANYTSGHLCPYCRDDPAGFPTPGSVFMWFRHLSEPWQTFVFLSAMFAFVFFTAAVVASV